MNVAIIGLLGALCGALIALLGSYVLNLRAEFASRAKALQEFHDSLEATREIIRAFNSSEELWSAGTQLAPVGWTEYLRDLMPCFKAESWSELRRFVRRLAVADRWADTLRAAARAPGGDFTQNLTEIDKALPLVEGKVEDARLNTRANVRFARATTFGVITAPVAAVVISAILLAPGPHVTGDSLAQALHSRLPGAASVICDKSTTIEGDYACTAAFEGCAQEPIASTSPPSCPGVRDAIYQVATHKTSFNATLSKEVGGQTLTGATRGLRKLLVITGLVKP